MRPPYPLLPDFSRPGPQFVRRWPVAVAGLGLVMQLACLPTAHAWLLDELPTPQQVRQAHQPSDALVLDRHGQVLHRQRVDFSVRRGQWVSLQDVSPALRLALVASEDRRFYAHSGVDWQAVGAAAWGNLWNTRTRGASTITMQLAGLLGHDGRDRVDASGKAADHSTDTPGPTARSGRRSPMQKMTQALAATRLERHWRKDEILEAYLNLVPFRGELAGVDALSRSLFGRAAHALDNIEAAITAALVRAPNAAPATVQRRACAVLRDMLTMQAGELPTASASPPQSSPAPRPDAPIVHDGPSLLAQTSPAPPVEGDGLCAMVAARTQQALSSRQWPPSEGMAPHWARHVLRQMQSPAQDGGKSSVAGSSPAGTAPVPQQRTVHTTVRADVQRLAVHSLRQHLRELTGRNVQDGAVLVLDNATGQVLAWVGSSGELSLAPDVDAVTALRQPGSTLKPFLYAQAIAQHRLTAASLIHDAPSQIAAGNGLYIPQNYDRQFKGWVSARLALASSLNVPAVRTLIMVTPDAFARQLHELGMPLPMPAGYYGLSLALGSAEVQLLHLTNAYRALANGGQWSPVAAPLLALDTAPQHPQAARQVLDAGAAFIVGDILSDPQARALTFGPDSVLNTRFWSAVKTGTSKDMRDNWAVGWSRRYTVGVWVGNATGSAMHNVSGSSGAAPVWAQLMHYLHSSEGQTCNGACAPSVQDLAAWHSTSTLQWIAAMNRPPAPPPRLLRQRVHFLSEADSATGRRSQALESSRQEWFMPGTQQTLFHIPAPQGASTTGATAHHGRAPARILHPTPDTIIALDPDIPPGHQSLLLRASRGQVLWRAAALHHATPSAVPASETASLGRGRNLSWLPPPGSYRVELLDAPSGEVLDSVIVHIRGAVRPGQQASPQAGR